MKKILLLAFFILIFIIDINAQTSTALSINDTRDNSDLPNFVSNIIRADFKLRNSISVPGEGAYSTNLTLGQWHDNSGDKNHQLNFNNGGIFYRNAFAADPQWGSWRQLLLANENGNVGIGIALPSANLEIYTPVITQGVVYNNQKWSSGNSGYDLKLQSVWTTQGINQEIIQRFDNIDYKSLAFFKGNVGIGTSNPDSKLAVNGTIHSKEVKVDMIGWPDFVFKKEYDLPTLEEVESYINEKGHLANIPSEKEVIEKGLNLGEMNAKLLQKIEELTLYTIQQSKEIQVLKKENESVLERLVKIEKQLK